MKCELFFAEKCSSLLKQHII